MNNFKTPWPPDVHAKHPIAYHQTPMRALRAMDTFKVRPDLAAAPHDKTAARKHFKDVRRALERML